VKKGILLDKIVLALHQKFIVEKFLPLHSLYAKECHFDGICATKMLLFSQKNHHQSPYNIS